MSGTQIASSSKVDFAKQNSPRAALGLGMQNSGFTSHYLHKDSMSVQEESKDERFGDSFRLEKPRNSARNQKGTKIRLHKEMASYKMNSNPSGEASDLQQTLATTALGGGGISSLL